VLLFLGDHRPRAQVAPAQDWCIPPLDTSSGDVFDPEFAACSKSDNAASFSLPLLSPHSNSNSPPITVLARGGRRGVADCRFPRITFGRSRT